MIYLNLECGVLTVEGISTAKIIRFHRSSMKLRIHENCVIVVPVNILTVWRAGFLGLTTCLDIASFDLLLTICYCFTGLYGDFGGMDLCHSITCKCAKYSQHTYSRGLGVCLQDCSGKSGVMRVNLVAFQPLEEGSTQSKTKGLSS